MDSEYHKSNDWLLFTFLSKCAQDIYKIGDYLKESGVTLIYVIKEYCFITGCILIVICTIPFNKNLLNKKKN